MRPLLALAAVAAVALPAPPATAAWSPDVDGARAYAKERRGDIAFHVRTPTRAWGWRSGRTYPSASVLKAMMLVAYLDRPEVRGRALTNADRKLLSPMIRRSDNDAANRVVVRVGTKGLRRVARRARMTDFTPVLPIWGNSRITAADGSRLMLRIEALLPAAHRAYAMKLLASVVPSQRWGIGRVSLPGWTSYFKGGWGSATGAVDHQVVLLARGDERVALAIMTANDGTHAYGNETLRGVAKRLLRGLPREGAVP